MRTAFSPWRVHILGRASNLDYLASSLGPDYLRIQKDVPKPGFYMDCDRFAGCTDSAVVFIAAEEILAQLSGLLLVTRGNRDRLLAGSVMRMNASGGWDVFVHIHEMLTNVTDFFSATVEVADAHGNQVPVKTHRPRSMLIMNLAFSNSDVAKVLRLLAAQDAESWVGLYRIFEVIECSAGGSAALLTKGWGSHADLRRFKHSANSVHVAGDAARHGAEANPPPKAPMSIEEARVYVTNLRESWLVELVA
jgi:hypothetical protein